VPCPSVIQNHTNPKQQKELLTSYRKNIRNTQKILAGQVNVVKKNLEKEMQTLSNQEEYREANLIKRQIEQINYITQPRSDVWEYHQNPNFLTDRRGQEEQALKQLLTPYFKFISLKRIECFDVAHLAGTAPTASMVTFEAGEPNKKFYRHFKIQTQLKGDTDRIFEVIKRRIKHFTDWGKPDLLFIDGGKPQVSAAQKALAEAGIGIPVIGLAKREETIVIKKKEGFVLVKPQKQALFLLQRLRDEAHRFARRYHHKLISAIFKG
jgi:excinuclease UvrABC nuclease subunit